MGRTGHGAATDRDLSTADLSREEKDSGHQSSHCVPPATTQPEVPTLSARDTMLNWVPEHSGYIDQFISSKIKMQVLLGHVGLATAKEVKS